MRSVTSWSQVRWLVRRGGRHAVPDQHGMFKEDISGRLETVATAEGPPSYSSGSRTPVSTSPTSRPQVPILTSPKKVRSLCTATVMPGARAAPPRIEVMNGLTKNNLKGAVIGCDASPTSAASRRFLGGDGPAQHGRSVAPVAPADVTKPLPQPTEHILYTIEKRCGAAPGDHGPPIPRLTSLRS